MNAKPMGDGYEIMISKTYYSRPVGTSNLNRESEEQLVWRALRELYNTLKYLRNIFRDDMMKLEAKLEVWSI